MKDTLRHILTKYNVKTDVIEIPNVTRDDLASVFHDLDFRVGAEIGVAAGEFSQHIMEANPQLDHMYGIDPYEPYKGYKDYKRLGTFTKLEEEARARLEPYDNYRLLKMTSADAAHQFPDESLDFVYIDANHAEPYVSEDINLWAPKVRRGGIVAGHDYARIRGTGMEDSTNWAVIPAIHKYIKDHDKQLIIWGLEAKIPGLKREGSRSWSFVQ